MTTSEFVVHLAQQNIHCSVVGSKLRIDAPKGAITSQLLADLVERKPEIIAFLRQSKQGNSQLAGQDNNHGLWPVSYVQEGIWFLNHLFPGSAVSNIVSGFRCVGKLNTEALQRSLNEVIRRHAILRTTFKMIDHQLSQIIQPASTVTLPVVDFSALSETEAEKKALQMGTDQAEKPFNLAESPLFRISVVRLTEEHHVIFLVLHHVVGDGWSSGIFYSELMTFYRSFIDSRPSPLPELPIQYVQFAQWQRRRLTGETLDALRAYWKKQLAGDWPFLELPTDRPRPRTVTFNGAHKSFRIRKDLRHSIKDFSRQNGITVFITLLTGFVAILFAYTGQEDILLTVGTANRTRLEFENVIGPFVNTLILRLDLSGNPTFRELLQRARDVTLAAYEHGELPFEKIMQELKIKRDPARPPLRAGFGFFNWPEFTVSIPGLAMTRVEVENGATRLDLVLEMEERDGHLQGTMEYNTDLFVATTIERISADLETALCRIVANPLEKLETIRSVINAETPTLSRNHQPGPISNAAPALLQRLDSMSELEIDALLAELLRK